LNELKEMTLNMANEKCLVCGKDILTEDIFMKVNIDMHRLIYNENEKEKNFLIPDGPVRMTTKLYLCDNCSRGLMSSAPKDMAIAIVESKNKFLRSRVKNLHLK
jgi:hypothetical protein